MGWWNRVVVFLGRKELGLKNSHLLILCFPQLAKWQGTFPFARGQHTTGTSSGENCVEGVKFHTFSNYQWHFLTAAIMLLTWPWLLQVKGCPLKQSLSLGSEENGLSVWKSLFREAVGLCLPHFPVDIWTTVQMQSRSKLGQLCTQWWQQRKGHKDSTGQEIHTLLMYSSGSFISHMGKCSSACGLS